MFRGWNRASRNYPAGTWNYHGQRRFLPRSLLTAKSCSLLTFSWYSVWFPPGCSGHKVTTHFLIDNTTGIYGCIISASGLWQSLKNVLISNKTTKKCVYKVQKHVLLHLVTHSQILQGIFTTGWCTVLSHCCTTPAQEQLRAAELASPRAFVITSDLGVWTVWFYYTGFQQTFFSWSPDEEHITWVDEILLFCHTFYIMFCMVALKTKSKSRFINREWVTHHQKANSVFVGCKKRNYTMKLAHINSV